MLDIKKYLNGVARMIKYDRDGSKKIIKSIIEGEMVNGSINGYARKLYISPDEKQKDTLKTNCQVGYWKELAYKDPKKGGNTCQCVCSPNGKWAWFITNEKKETFFKVPFSIYGSKLEGKDKIRVLKTSERDIRSCKKNSNPNMKKA